MANLGCAPHHVNVLKKGSVPTIFSAEQFGTPANCLRQLRAQSPGAGPTTIGLPHLVLGLVQLRLQEDLVMINSKVD